MGDVVAQDAVPRRVRARGIRREMHDGVHALEGGGDGLEVGDVGAMKRPRPPVQPTPRRLIAIDLFAGAGGLTLGLRQGGFAVVGAIESQELAASSYRRNHRKTIVWHRPIENVAAAEVRRRLRLEPGDLDMLAGCPPCQGFSTMRTKNGRRQSRDSSKDLLFQFLRFVRALRPKIIMMENVPRLSVDRRMSSFRSQLKKLGYHCKTDVLNAIDYGVPQSRRRMIFLAGRVGPYPSQKSTPRA